MSEHKNPPIDLGSNNFSEPQLEIFTLATQEDVKLICEFFAQNPDMVNYDPDTNQINVTCSCFKEENGRFTPMRYPFFAAKNTPLKPFFYDKPSGDPLKPTTIREANARNGFYPVGIITDPVRRPPNHLHVSSPALVAVFEPTPGRLESRFFPQTNIPEATWAEAKAILADTTVQTLGAEANMQSG